MPPPAAHPAAQIPGSSSGSARSLLVLGLYLAREWFPWAVAYPQAAKVPFDAWFSAAMAWLKTNITWLTRWIAAILDVPLKFAFAILAKGYKIGNGPEAIILPTLSWVGVVAVAAIAGHAAGGRKLALLVGGCFLYIALFGQWQSAMLTLALIVIAVPLCVVVGLAFGILAWRVPWLDRSVITPALDLMQTIPTFAYLIPMLILFGNSPVSAMLATGIFATPPMVRATALALSRVPKDIDEFGTMAGCTRRQKLWRVLIPSARPTLMVGVNQVIMLALNMVIISSMIGAGGLGYDVLLALRALKIGQAMEAGLAIVALAIALDRLSQAAATLKPAAVVAAGPFWRRNPHLVLALGILAVTTLLDFGRAGLCESSGLPHLLDRACLEGGGRLGDREFLRRDRGVSRRPPRLCAQSRARVLPGLPVARRRVPARRSRAISWAACGSRPSSPRSPPSAP